MTENEVAKQIVDVAFKIHTTFGPGLLESVYETIIAYELQKRGLQVIRQQAIPVVYESIRMVHRLSRRLDRRKQSCSGNQIG